MKLLLVVFLLVSLTDLAAQEIPSIAGGTQVRIKTPRIRRAIIGVSWIAGSVVSLEADTLMLKEENSETTLPIPVAAMTALEVRTPRGWRDIPLAELVRLPPIEPSLIVPGTRTRMFIRAPSGSYTPYLGTIYVGTIVWVDRRNLTLQVKRDTQLVIPLASVASLEVSHKPRGKGALIGAGIGILGAVVIGAVDATNGYTEEQCDGFLGCLSPEEVFALAVLILGPPLAIVGALVGAESVREHWKPLPLPLDLGLLPQGRGYIAVRFEFGK